MQNIKIDNNLIQIFDELEDRIGQWFGGFECGKVSHFDFGVVGDVVQFAGDLDGSSVVELVESTGMGGRGCNVSSETEEFKNEISELISL